MTVVREAERVLRLALDLVTGPRRTAYGPPTQNFTDTADLWTVLFRRKLREGERFEASDIPLAMVALKSARLSNDRTALRADNWADVAGYAACGAETDSEGDASAGT